MVRPSQIDTTTSDTYKGCTFGGLEGCEKEEAGWLLTLYCQARGTDDWLPVEVQRFEKFLNDVVKERIVACPIREAGIFYLVADGYLTQQMGGKFLVFTQKFIDAVAEYHQNGQLEPHGLKR